MLTVKIETYRLWQPVLSVLSVLAYINLSLLLAFMYVCLKSQRPESTQKRCVMASAVTISSF
jgi:hypothetical protein